MTTPQANEYARFVKMTYTFILLTEVLMICYPGKKIVTKYKIHPFDSPRKRELSKETCVVQEILSCTAVLLSKETCAVPCDVPNEIPCFSI